MRCNRIGIFNNVNCYLSCVGIDGFSGIFKSISTSIKGIRRIEIQNDGLLGLRDKQHTGQDGDKFHKNSSF